jgi:hypothetical protein
MSEPATWTASNGNVWRFIRTEQTVGVEGFSPEHQRKMVYVDRICKVTRPDGTFYYDCEMIDCRIFHGEVANAGS